MRQSLFLICVFGLSCAAWSQTNRASWENLTALQPRQKIQIVDLNSKKHSGTFVSVSDTAVSYQEAEGEQTIQKQDVRSLKLMENKYRFEGPSQTSTMTDNLTSNHQQAKARA